jgi:hypothetical protein
LQKCITHVLNRAHQYRYTYANVINNSLSSNRAFTPIDSLYRKDADITLLFLSSDQVISPVEINDPWYSAHSTVPGVRLNFTGFGNLTTGGFFADEPVSVLGCANQYQICYPDKKGKPSNCSRLGGKQELYWLLTSLAQSERQLNRTKWSIMSALTGNELGGLVQTLGAASLSSKYSFVSGVQGPLPDNQWQLDVEHWHAATLVAMQGSAVDAASGPSDPKMKSFWAAPANNEERAVCNNQVSDLTLDDPVRNYVMLTYAENSFRRPFQLQRLWSGLHLCSRRADHRRLLHARITGCIPGEAI